MDKLYELVRRFEGLRLKPYQDSVGVWTVGYGHTGLEVNEASPQITLGLAEMLMEEDAATAVNGALKLSPELALSQDRLAAIADFIFNLGATRYKASTLRRKIRDDDWDDAEEEIQKWVYAGGKKLPGLILRRAAEAALL